MEYRRRGLSSAIDEYSPCSSDSEEVPRRRSSSIDERIDDISETIYRDSSSFLKVFYDSIINLIYGCCKK